MRYGVFSDVHGNLEALKAVLGHFESEGVDAHLCCGDLVGYGPDPEACLGLIRSLKGLSVVGGNHDLAVAGRMDLEWFNPYARTAAIWTRAHLSRQALDFLEGLPLRVETSDWTMVHGSPRKPPEEYLLSPAQFQDCRSYVKAWPLFMGHSHMPLAFRSSAAGTDVVFLGDREESAAMEGGVPAPAAFNPGSVGQPRDHDPRASCGVYDTKTRVFRIARLSYDYRLVQGKIREAGLPEYLALRLEYGQ
ncbi:MAG: metallophosphoesterase family protein [Elusimicrobia bacterium]|nr:metallophosphoesterase family protein [Elusimicrobiota bacterium]